MKEKIKQELVNLLTYPKDTQYHINLTGIYLNWFIMVLYLLFGSLAGIIGIGISIIGLIIWEIIYWKNNWSDSIKDLLIGILMLTPSSTLIIKNFK